ncbi:unnamed protein product [Thelazia callipaeda]|uniref:C2H2-type domain-containing protein n=1 Tax=Thelazia callipaeda TaxID=103827 RepID=A0A158RD53_THECL|nr:unnamed protein product [Thelazia callipaeda]
MSVLDVGFFFSIFFSEVCQALHSYVKINVLQMDSGKSPLAMLAKTCETIGLPDTSHRKSTKDSDKSKELTSPSSSNASGEHKKDEHSPSSKNKKEGSKSPRHAAHSPPSGRKTPISSEPSTSSAAASLPANLMLNARGCFPMSFSPLATTFPTFPYPSLIPGFPAVPNFATAGAFGGGTPNPFLRCPDPLTCKGCPATLMTRPCVTPGCTSCTMHSATAANTPADLMMAFPPSFFAAAYSPLLSSSIPPTSSSAAQFAYQNLMAAASGQSTKHVCNWIDSANGVCGKSFPTADELAAHMKLAHVPSTTSNNNIDLKASSSPRTSTTTTSLINHAAAASLRYHPYMKPSGLIPAVPSPLGMPSFQTMTGFPSAAALQAMYTQRLMATMPHP